MPQYQSSCRRISTRGKLPRRPFVLGYRFMIGAVTLGVAPPGTGKSNFSILTALSIATGQALTGEPVHRAGPGWIHNNEDSLDELYRRVSGALKFHQIEFDSVRANIFATRQIAACRRTRTRRLNRSPRRSGT